MAHVAKYQAGALGRMGAHYARSNEAVLERDNIDRQRTHMNYNLAPQEGTAAEVVAARVAQLDLKRKPRKDAVMMVDCVVTQPKTLDPSRSREFFESVYRFMSARYGEQNVVSAYVHMDETTPHMHFAWVPVTPDGRLSAKSVVCRADLNTLHQDMQRAVSVDMGQTVDVLLDDSQQARKALSKLEGDEFRIAAEKLAQVQKQEQEARERLESVRQETRRVESECAGLEREYRELQPLAAMVERYEGESRSGKVAIVAEVVSYLENALKAAYQALNSWFFGLAASQAQEAVLDVPAPAFRITSPSVGRRGQVRSRSLEHDAARAREAAHELSTNRRKAPGRGGDAR